MHIVGYFYENYHDARSPEHKVWLYDLPQAQLVTARSHHKYGS